MSDRDPAGAGRPDQHPEPQHPGHHHPDHHAESLARAMAAGADAGTAELVADVEGEFAQLVMGARRWMRRLAERVDGRLLPFDFKVLSVVDRHAPVRQGRVVDELDTDKSMVSRSVRRLLDLGLLDRVPDPGDGRASLLRLSPEGRERFAAASAEHRGAMTRRLAAWSPAELRQLRELLAKLRESGPED